ncbi:MAG: FkbM family methyltransferase, partial [Candidatus Helarchaeota archaeon]|nr:FkbM family methyltransferase [Candidatus Helarchaeota archaeon]
MAKTLKQYIFNNFLISRILDKLLINYRYDLSIFFEKCGLNKNSKVIFDVGAYIGDYTKAFLKLFPKAIIWAFEPCLKTFKILKYNTRKFYNRVKLFNMGLIDENAKKKLYLMNFNAANSFIPLSDDFKKVCGTRETKSQEIIVKRLDDFVQEHNIKHIDIIKIDVEGVEYKLLQGGKDSFKNIIDKIIIEISLIRKGLKSDNINRVFNFLYKNDFYLRNIYQLGRNT